ncbi:hypothetical protein ACFE04_004898 [Oxalis oulophora]
MSKLFAKLAGLFSNRTPMGVDKAGNRYFIRNQEIDGFIKEKRWVVFKGEDDPTSIPVEWICWLNGQRKSAPTPQEMAEMELRRELVKQNVARLKKEEEEKKKKNNKASSRKTPTITKTTGPDLNSFMRQFPTSSQGGKESVLEKEEAEEPQPKTTEPTGAGSSFKPGTWQPPT